MVLANIFCHSMASALRILEDLLLLLRIIRGIYRVQCFWSAFPKQHQDPSVSYAHLIAHLGNTAFIIYFPLPSPIFHNISAYIYIDQNLIYTFWTKAQSSICFCLGFCSSPDFKIQFSVFTKRPHTYRTYFSLHLDFPKIKNKTSIYIKILF